MNWYWWVLIGVGVVVLVPNIILHLVVWRQGTWLWENKYRYTFLPEWWPVMRGKSWVFKLLLRGFVIFLSHRSRQLTRERLDIKLAHEAKGHVDHARRWISWTLWLGLYLTIPGFRCGAECQGVADGMWRQQRWEGAWSLRQLEDHLWYRAKRLKRGYLLWGITKAEVYKRLRTEYEKARPVA